MIKIGAARKILFWGALFILMINAVKNIRSLTQLIGGRAPTVLMESKETILTLIALFIILGAAIRDARFRVAWFMIICNELLAMFAVSIFGNGDRFLSTSVILLGTFLLIIGGVNFMKAKEVISIEQKKKKRRWEA